MASKRPKDLQRTLVSQRFAAPVLRQCLSLGQWTVNTTVTPTPVFVADRLMVIREIWFSLDAVPSDPDGTMLVNALVYDESEAADDTIVVSHDAEAVHVEARKAYKAALAAETAENQLTLEAGDTIRFTLVNNSAAITTNANVNALIIYQPLKPV